MKTFTAALFTLVSAVTLCAAETGLDPQVDAAFPGGNIVVDSIKGDTINIHRDLRDTDGDWFYYYFRVRGAEGRQLTINFTQRDPTTSLGPAVSTDGGITWNWLGAERMTRHSDTALANLCVDSSIIRASFQYEVPKNVQEVRFCLGMAYTETNLQAFLQHHKGSKNLRVEALCTTKKGRTTEALYLGRLDGKAQIRALITARHHSCEMMASHELEGIMESILADPSDGQWLRDHVEFLIIPFMDKDGVEDGDQGKDRKPHDHNRDYAGTSIYPSVAALKSLVPQWSKGKFQFALDLHCPAHRYPCHEVIYGPTADFARILEKAGTGPLRFKFEDYADCRPGPRTEQTFPLATNQQPEVNLQTVQRDPRASFVSWARSVPGVGFSGLIELPYAIASGRTVTSESARIFGHDVAKAIRQYLEETQK